MSGDTYLRWNGPGKWSVVESDRQQPTVIDSWLLNEGCVRALPLHLLRFKHATSFFIGQDSLVSEFLQDVVERLPVSGCWFPRIELVAAETERYFCLRLRSAPVLRESVRVWVDCRPDSRLNPEVKGPDLALLARKREELRLERADELLLIDECGRLLEGASSSLLWWQGETLCTVPEDAPVLRGVTRSLILMLARKRQITIRTLMPAAEELAGAETWLVNALHGIRLVTDWINADIQPGAGRQLRQWLPLLAVTSVAVAK